MYYSVLQLHVPTVLIISSLVVVETPSFPPFLFVRLKTTTLRLLLLFVLWESVGNGPEVVVMLLLLLLLLRLLLFTVRLWKRRRRKRGGCCTARACMYTRVAFRPPVL